MSHAFPIDDVLPQLAAAFNASRNVILSAPPGAGKTTRVPLELLKAAWMNGKRMVMLEPRRLAARRAAEFMSSQLGQTVGATIGYRTRGDSRITNATRIEVVTEGVLTRMLHENPELPGVALVVFDEFHERSINADLGLALTIDVQENLREELRVLVMSATLDGVPIAELLRHAVVVKSEGKSFPVQTRYLQFAHRGVVEQKVVEVVTRALREEAGDVLVFLPGQREIRRVQRMLQDGELSADVALHMLYGEASDEAQRSALVPAPDGARKVILSTSIAETSLTIDGVRIVVDAGLARSSRFDPRRGMSGLVTTPVSRASADQRRGRAGRQQPGVCYRLWTEGEHEQLSAHPVPEILSTDLAPFALDLARWGRRSDLRFLDPPPAAHLQQAKELLYVLGALDSEETLSPHGKLMADLPIHPRLAHMLLRAKELGLGALACDVAALLEERDILRGQQGADIDFNLRWNALRRGTDVDQVARSRVLSESRRLRGLLGITHDHDGSEQDTGVLLALAYPERVARRRGGQTGRYQMASGTGALIPEWSPLAREEFIVIADVDGVGTEVRAFLAAPLQKEELLETFADSITLKEEVFWSSEEDMVVARSVRVLDMLVVEEQETRPDRTKAVTAMVEGIRLMGLASLPWSRESESVRSRSEWLRGQHLVDDAWPDLSDGHLLDTLDTWLAPFLDGMTRRVHLSRLEMTAVLGSLFSYLQRKELDRLAPLALEVPTGSHIRLDYSSGIQPVLSVKLQEMFGQIDTPTIAGGRVSVRIHLLSPAGRPLAVTQDLRSFWSNAYTEVRKQMRGRYPKHPWPEDPLSATPTRRTKR